MFRNLTCPGVAFVVATLFLTAAADADDWRVVQSSGPVWVHTEGAQPVALGPDTVLPDGATLATGDGSRVLLAHGTQTLVVGPNAVVTVPAGDSDGVTTVLQRAGEVEFDVDRQKAPHFAVETPYLAAIVKGTHFTVRIDHLWAAVSVDRGLVEVTDLATGEKVDVPAGRSANVDGGTDGKLTVGGWGQQAILVKGAPRAPLVAAVSKGELAALQAGPPAGTEAPSSGGSSVQGGGLTALAAAGFDGNDGGGGSGGGAGADSLGGIDRLGEPRASVGAQAGSADFVAGAGTVGQGGSGVGAIAEDGPKYMGSLRAFHTRDEESPLSAMTIAICLSLSVLLAVGLAYFRGRAG